MKKHCMIAIGAAWVSICGSVALGAKPRTFLVIDNHPTGGAGATGQQLLFQEGDPQFKVEGPGKCGHLFLGGFAFGHADPRIKTPTAVCGHGIVFPTVQDINTGPAPLSILPIEAPMPVEAGASAAVDAGKLIRDMLPKLDRSDGDKLPVVIELRSTIRSLDVFNVSKNTPKRQARQ